MKRFLLAAALALFSMPAFAASLGYQQVTGMSTSSAVSLPSVPGNAGSALIYVEGGGIRWRDDGTDPTSTVGMPISAGQAFCYINDNHTVRFIAQAAGAIMNVTYYPAGTCR